jgi:hypothetical protein
MPKKKKKAGDIVQVVEKEKKKMRGTWETSLNSGCDSSYFLFL